MTDSRTTAPRWAVLIALLPLAVGALLFARHVFLVVTYPHEVNQFEGHDLFFGLRAAEGLSLYPALEGYPFAANPYPPVHSLALGLLIRLFGLGLAPGRILSVLSILAIAALIARAVHRRAGKMPALGAALLFLGATAVTLSAPLIKADPLGNALALAGLLLVTGELRARGVGRRAHLLAGGFFLLLALFTKQTYLAAPVAACVALLYESRRRALVFAACLAGSAAALIGLLTLLTDSQYLFHVLTVAGAPPLTWEQLSRLSWAFFLQPALPLLIVALAVTFAPRRPDPLLVWVLLELALVVTAARAGAHYNYFIGPAAALAILFGLALGQPLMRDSRRLATILWLLAAAYSTRQILATSDHQEARSPWINRSIAREVDRLVTEEPRDRPVLVEMAYHALRHDRPWLVHAQSALEAKPFRPPRELLADCAAAKFGLVLSKRFLPSLLGTCLQHNYESHGQILEPYAWSLGNTWTIYRPKPPQPGQMRSFTVTGLREIGSSTPMRRGNGSLRVETFTAGFLDLAATVAACHHCSAFLTTRVYSERQVPAQLLLGADNGVGVALNGRPIFESGLLDGAALPDSMRVPLTLEPGINVIELRVDQIDDQWGLYARLVADDGDALPPGVRFLDEGEGTEARQLADRAF